MKAAIIGGGFAADLHASALRSCGIELAAAVASTQESAERFARKWQIPRFGTDPELALEEEIGAVHICTPPAAHGAYAEAALSAGKRVLCEKPLCFSPQEARRLAELSEKSGIQCAVNYNVRYHMAVRRARELAAGGRFGRPLLIHGSYQQ